MNRISVSSGNRKMRGIPSMSFPPIKTCRAHAPCASVCYACKPYLNSYSVRNAWQQNLDLYEQNPTLFFDQLRSYLVWHQVKYFRWFVAGDIPDEAFFLLTKKLCLATPGTSHLMFTKRYDLSLDVDNLPSNLNLLISAFPRLEIPKWAMGLRKAFYQDGREERTSGLEHVCSGNCQDCLHCWQSTGDVVFFKH